MRPPLGMLTCAAVAIISLGIGPVAAPAGAVEVRPDKCVVDVSNPSPRTVCFGSFRAAIAKATGGRITETPDDARVAMRDRRFDARMNAIDAQPAPD